VQLMPEQFFSLKADLTEMVGKQKIISATIGPCGEACLLMVAQPDESLAFGYEKRTDVSVCPRGAAERSYRATFVVYEKGLKQRIELGDIQQAFPTAQPLPNGEILIIGSRCHFGNGDPEKNAAVYDRCGNLLRRFVVGDGIEEVQTTRDGLIWISYFDEGVFGDDAIGASGIVCFDGQGRKVWDFEAPPEANTMADCYAMNVADDVVWACYYTDFPVVRIDREKKVQAWRNLMTGAGAMAVDDQRVVLWGGYGENRTRCVVQEYSEGDQELKNARRVELKFPDEVDVKRVRVLGRGATLHAFVGTRLYSWMMNR
jgi:hypothetical protein